MKLAKIAAQLEVRLRGDGEVEIKGLQGIADAQPGELTFVSNPKYVAAARTTRASAIIVAEDFPELAKPTLRTPDPYFTFARAVELFYQPPRYAPASTQAPSSTRLPASAEARTSAPMWSSSLKSRLAKT